jgi:hypothetical protein
MPLILDVIMSSLDSENRLITLARQKPAKQ